MERAGDRNSWLFFIENAIKWHLLRHLPPKFMLCGKFAQKHFASFAAGKKSVTTTQIFSCSRYSPGLGFIITEGNMCPVLCLLLFVTKEFPSESLCSVEAPSQPLG